MNKSEYIICRSWSIEDIIQQVNEAIEDGFFPIGGITFDGKEFYQAMVINQIPSCSC